MPSIAPGWSRQHHPGIQRAIAPLYYPRAHRPAQSRRCNPSACADGHAPRIGHHRRRFHLLSPPRVAPTVSVGGSVALGGSSSMSSQGRAGVAELLFLAIHSSQSVYCGTCASCPWKPTPFFLNRMASKSYCFVLSVCLTARREKEAREVQAMASTAGLGRLFILQGVMEAFLFPKALRPQ